MSADIAFDAAVKTYKPADVVFLEYHLHIPGPDPLTNADTEGRVKLYAANVRGTPTVFVNGKVVSGKIINGIPQGLGGGKANGEDRYGQLRQIVDEA